MSLGKGTKLWILGLLLSGGLAAAGICGCDSGYSVSAQEQGGSVPVQSDEVQSEATVTPVTASVISPGGTGGVLGTDKAYHVMYELLLANATSAPAQLKSLEALDPDGKVVLTMRADDMIRTEALLGPGRETAKNTIIPPGGTRVLLLAAKFDSEAAIPTELKHRFQVNAANPLSPDPALLDWTYVALPVPLSGPGPVMLAPPLKGAGWFVSQGPPTPDSHQSAIVPFNGHLVAAERFAADLIRVDDRGRIVNGDPTVLSNWVGYGEKVYAVGNGVVTQVVDGLPEQIPGDLADLPVEELPGNSVVLKLGNGSYVVYAHLQKGTIRVQRGQTVSMGQQLGLLGNSGGTTAPHLHLHVTDGPSPISSDGVPYVYTNFELAGAAQPRVLLDGIKGLAAFPARATLSPVPRENEIPLGDDIIDFPGP